MERGCIRFLGKQFESNGEKMPNMEDNKNLSLSICYRETNHCSL